MNQELYLSNLISEMLEKHNCHSIILYGSRADNSHRVYEKCHQVYQTALTAHKLFHEGEELR
jgi:hypothetical protein